MSKKKKLLMFGGGGAVVVVALLGFALWWLVLRDDAPEAVSLAGALSTLPTATASATSPSAGATAGTGTPTTAPPAASTGGINGSWTVDATQKSFLGYRVEEQLATFGANTAVGRTAKVTGQAVIADGALTAATVTGDLTQLKSDNNLRDGQLRNQAIETQKFPNATFTLGAKVDLPATVESGQAVEVTLAGTLELHGVKKQVQVPVHAQLSNGLLVVVGSIDIRFSDYNIASPRGAAVLSIEDHGVMELQLFLKRG